MKNLPIEMLRTLTVVQTEGGFTAAAEKLGRTQPAVSQQIKKLEALLGRQLVDRSSSRLALTEAGQSLLRYAQQILALNDAAVGVLTKPPVSGRIQFGIPSEFAITLLPRIVSRFAKAYPDVALEVTCDLSRNLLSAERRHHYDLILALHDKPSAEEHYLRRDQLVWVGAETSRVWQQTPLPLIAAPDGCIYRRRALTILQQAGHKCRIVYTIPDLTGIQAAINEGLGVTVLAKSTVPESLAVLESSSQLPSLGDIGISLERVDRNSHAVRVLADFIAMELI